MATYQVHVDWDRNANYSGTYDDISAYVRSINLFNGFKEPYANVAGEKTLHIELDNSDRRFSPEYSAGPLFGKRFRNRPIRVQVVSGGTTVLWVGTTDTITPQTNINGERRAILTATSLKRKLDTMQSYVELQINQPTDQIILAILNGVVVPDVLSVGPWVLGVPGYSEVGSTTVVGSGVIPNSLEAGTLTPPYAGDGWGDGVSVYEAIKQVVEAERGKVFFDRNDQLVFWNRNHFITDYTDLATYTDAQIISFDYIYGVGMQNNVTVRYAPRQISAAREVLWQLDSGISIPNGTEKKIRAKFSEQGSNSKVAAVSTERPSEDNGSMVFSTGSADLVGWKPDANGAEMILAARNGNVQVDSIIIYGIKLTTYNKGEVQARDGINEFYDDRQDVVYDLPLIDREADAQAIADYEVSRRSSARGSLRSVTLMNKSAATLSAILTRQIGHRIRITEQQTGHAASYFIIGEEHQISDAGTKHVATWYLEPASSATFWLVGISGHSEVGATTTIAP